MIKKLIAFALPLLVVLSVSAQVIPPSTSSIENLTDVGITSLTNGQCLVYNSTSGDWENGACGSVSVITTQGDLIIGDASGDESRLAIGTSNQLLISNGTTASWATNITLGGTLTVTSDTQFKTEVGFDAIDSVTYNATTTTADWGTGNVKTMTFGAGNIGTLAFTDPSAVGQTVKLKLIQDGTGSRTVTSWDSDIQWPGGTAPTLTTDANGEDWVTCIFTNTGAGNRYDCAASLDFQ